MNLAELLHEIVLGVQAPRRVHDQDVGLRGTGGLPGIEGHGRRVAALTLGDDPHPGALAPDLKLLDGRGPEGVRRRHDDALSPLQELRGELARRGRLSAPVDADHQEDQGDAALTGLEGLPHPGDGEQLLGDQRHKDVLQGLR